MVFFQCEKSIEKQRNSSVFFESSGGSDQTLFRGQAEFSSAHSFFHRPEQVLGHGVFKNKKRPAPPVRSDKTCKRLTDASHHIAVLGDPSIDLLQKGEPRSEVVFEIVIEVKDERDAVLSRKKVADESIERVGTCPYDIHVTRLLVCLANEMEKTGKF
jgi:hypothetical protein